MRFNTKQKKLKEKKMKIFNGEIQEAKGEILNSKLLKKSQQFAEESSLKKGSDFKNVLIKTFENIYDSLVQIIFHKNVKIIISLVEQDGKYVQVQFTENEIFSEDIIIGPNDMIPYNIMRNFGEDNELYSTDTLIANRKAYKRRESWKRLRENIKNAEHLKDTLKKDVKGQDDVIDEVVDAIFSNNIIKKKDEERPENVFLFCGQPGVGKTYLSKLLAQNLNRPTKIFEMSEYATRESELRLFGIASFYANSRDGELTDFVKNNPNALLVFDEFEKASRELQHCFLQILGEGKLKSGYSDEEVSFKNTIIIFTTNAGKNLYANNRNPRDISKSLILEALITDINPLTELPYFSPEICSRFMGFHVEFFHAMSISALESIAKNRIDEMLDRVREQLFIDIVADDNLSKVVLAELGGKVDARIIGDSADKLVKKLLLSITEGVISANNDQLEEVEILIENDMNCGRYSDIDYIYEGNKMTILLNELNQYKDLDVVHEEGAVFAKAC